MCSFTLGHWIIPFLSILVVQIGTMKCLYCPQKDASVVLWDSLSCDDQIFLRDKYTDAGQGAVCDLCVRSARPSVFFSRHSSSGPPLLCRSPPLVLSQGWVGDRQLVNPNFFVAAHCVVVWVTVLWGTATCIPCTHGGTFCLLSLKWNLTAQPGAGPKNFTPSRSRSRSPYIGCPLNVSYADIFRFMLQFLCLQMCVYGGSAVPRGGGGGVTW